MDEDDREVTLYGGATVFIIVRVGNTQIEDCLWFTAEDDTKKRILTELHMKEVANEGG